MSLIRRIVTNFDLAFKSTRKLRKDLNDLQLEVSGLRSQISELQGGSAHSPGLNLDSPLIFLKITEIAEVGAAGRRLNIVPWNSLPYPPENPGDPAGPAMAYEEFGEHSAFVVDKDDTQLYLIETDATMPLVFVGARVLCVNTRLLSQGDEPAKAHYRPIAGEVFGFYVQLGDPDGNDRYPWKQVWPISHQVEGHPDHYTDETEPLGVGMGMLGLAQPFERIAHDTQITVRHRNYANRKVFLFQKAPPLSGGFFEFNGYEEPEYVVCS